ncbi:hypothetical protein EAS54_18875 [Bradyrhizobium guangzhouense]|nr:hypothetical protein EAS54_18875 [Bradyrhizobium guangzhouense]
MRELSPAAAHPDAALIELGKQYERLLREEVPLQRRSHRLHQATEARQNEILGLAPDAERSAPRWGVEWRQWSDAWETARAETGYDKAWEAWCQAGERSRDIGRKILRIRAQTLSGLLVRSRVITTNGDLLCKREPIEQLEREVRAFALRYQA